jgi:hypothetical protein
MALLLFTASGARAQTKAEQAIAPDSLNILSDTLSILSLIDSLMHLSYDTTSASYASVRMGYNSNVVSAARTLNFNQFGLSPGVSYYHKSGLYADLSGYWSNQYVPDYYLTVASAGYMYSYKAKWTFLTEYSHYFYTPSDSSQKNGYKNNLGASGFLNAKPMLFRLDYAFYFGSKHAHRISPGISLNIQKKNWLGLKRVLFYPSLTVLAGSEQIENTRRTYKLYTTKPAEILIRIKNNLPLYYYETSTHTKTKFGLMNYSISAPLSIAYKDWSFLVAYTYNIPKALPGENLQLTRSGYFSFSVSRFISFKAHDKKVF